MNDYGKKQYVWDERDATMHLHKYAFSENKYQHLQIQQ